MRQTKYQGGFILSLSICRTNVQMIYWQLRYINCYQ